MMGWSNERKAIVLRVSVMAMAASTAWGVAFERLANAPYEPEEPHASTRAAAARAADLAWKAVPNGVQASWGSIDVRYARGDVPAIAEKTKEWRASAWRGERVSAQLVLWTREAAAQVRFSTMALQDGRGDSLPADCVRPRFVRYVLAEGRLQPDALDTIGRLDLSPRSVRPIWVSINVPASARPGEYSGTLTVQAEGGTVLPFRMTVEVLPPVLPPPRDWSFHLDLWQNPWAVARYHGVEPWSPQHWAVLEATTKLLADAGQKCITTTLIDEPWGKQTYDPYGSMIEWVHARDGSWRFDYTMFDKFVEFGQRFGITGQISCYSMVPWGNQFQYLDEASGDYQLLKAEPGTPAYEAHWAPFLADFTSHLKAKGWLSRTAIAMDERSLEPMQKVRTFLKKTAPELKIAFAGSYHPALSRDAQDDFCYSIHSPQTPELIEQVTRLMPATFYVCCGPDRPNTFTFSPPAQSTWMGWHAAALGYTGFLRWAFDSWTADPLYDTNHVRWPAGDCFLAYPGGRSSIRFERLREGIADFEKIRLLRTAIESSSDEAAKRQWSEFNKALDRLKPFDDKTPFADVVREGKEALDVLSRQEGHLIAKSQ
jgi:YD repeat-containing protein